MTSYSNLLGLASSGGLVVTSSQRQRVVALLSKAELAEPARIPSLADEPAPSFSSEPLLPSNAHVARSLLVYERVNSPGYRPPEEQKRDKWLRVTDKQKYAARNQALWTFSLNEVASALNRLLSQQVLPPLNVCQALLSHAAGTSLEELWYHLHDPKLEKKKGRRYRTSESWTVPYSTWLDRVISERNTDYIHLLCQARPGQESLDRSLGTALYTKSIDSVKALLRFGATASAHQDAIREHIRLGDIALAKVLLSASPRCMSIEAWRYCLSPEVDGRKQPPAILLLCLAHRPSVACEDLFLQALLSQHYPAAVVLVAYGYLYHTSPFLPRASVRERACELASLVDDYSQRYDFFALLAEAGLLVDCHALRLELYTDVVARFLPLVRLLVGAGVSLDANAGTNTVQRAVSHMDFELLECFANVPFPFPAAVALGYAPDSTPEADMVRLVNYLAPRGLQGVGLDQVLVRATQKQHAQLVEKLLEHGASVEYGQGAAFLEAAGRCSLPLLLILHQRRPPNTAISKAVGIAFNARQACGNNAALATIKLLLGFGAEGETLHHTLVAATEAHDNGMANLLARNGADANYFQGASFKFALQARNFSLLWILCEASPPSRETIDAVLFTAIEPQSYRLDCLELLLASRKRSKGELRGSWAPAWSSKKLRGNPNLDTIVPCFLRHGMDVNLGNGVLVCFAVEEMSVTLLDDILEAGPSTVSLAAAFRTAVRVESRPFQLTSMRKLIEAAGRAEIGQSNALLGQTEIAIGGDPAGLETLLLYGAEVDHQNGAAVQAAAAAGSHSVLRMLIECLPSSHTLETAIFATEASLALGPEEKEGIFRMLLAASDQVLAADDGFSKLLIDSVTSLPQNSQLPALLIERGATVGLDVLSVALATASRELFGALTAALSNTAVPSVFRAAHKMTMNSDRRFWIYEILLDRGVVPPDDTTKALSSVVASWAATPNDPLNYKGGHHGVNFDYFTMYLLLTKGADPNKKAAWSFILAAAKGSEPVFRLLSTHANLNVVLRALLDNFTDEWQVLKWFDTCIEELPREPIIDDDELLVHSMRKFPHAAGLVRVLLDHRVSASTNTPHRFCSEWQEENCTPLIWALFSSQRIKNNVIMALLAYGGLSALPEYSTQESGVSAALGCILHKNRAPILKRLLSLLGHKLLSQTTPRATFARLAAGSAKKAKPDGLPLEVDMRQASMFLGNFEAYRELVKAEVPNDGTLHTAALLALPKFVKWLLNFHDADAKDADFDQMIPLAIACRSRPCPWSKISNQEADWVMRRNETIRLLAAKTSPEWKFNQKTILHIALEEGLGVTKVLVEALNVSEDPQRDERYLYTDKSGIEYSPDQWVLRIMDAGEPREKEKLVTYLQQLGMQSRYFRRVLPEHGQQPEGYMGLPPAYAEVWNPPAGDQYQGGGDRNASDDNELAIPKVNSIIPGALQPQNLWYRGSPDFHRVEPPYGRRPRY